MFNVVVATALSRSMAHDDAEVKAWRTNHTMPLVIMIGRRLMLGCGTAVLPFLSKCNHACIASQSVAVLSALIRMYLANSQGRYWSSS